MPLPKIRREDCYPAKTSSSTAGVGYLMVAARKTP